MEPILIAKENTPAVLQLIGQNIGEVIKLYPGLSFTNVVRDLYSAHRQLWVHCRTNMTIQAWMVTKVEIGEDGVRRLVVDLMGGEDLESLLPHWKRIEDWALKHGISQVRAMVRPGLRRKLRSLGFSHACDVIEKDLKGQLH